MMRAIDREVIAGRPVEVGDIAVDHDGQMVLAPDLVTAHIWSRESGDRIYRRIVGEWQEVTTS